MIFAKLNITYNKNAIKFKWEGGLKLFLNFDIEFFKYLVFVLNNILFYLIN